MGPGLEAFVGCFSELADPREDNPRHDLPEILLIALWRCCAAARTARIWRCPGGPGRGFFAADPEADPEAQAWCSEP